MIDLVARADTLWWERICGLRRRVILSAPDAEYVRHDRFIIACFPHHLIWPAASHIVSLQLTHEVNDPATEAARARPPVLDATHVPLTWTAGTDDESKWCPGKLELLKDKFLVSKLVPPWNFSFIKS